MALRGCVFDLLVRYKPRRVAQRPTAAARMAGRMVHVLHRRNNCVRRRLGFTYVTYVTYMTYVTYVRYVVKYLRDQGRVRSGDSGEGEG
eukprot:1392401-Amorphochlora_amoeboformis.AAC.1